MSDNILENLPINSKDIFRYANYKGWFFVTLSAALIFSLQYQYHKRLNQRLIELKHANEDLKLFFYKASHDLHGPVKSILGLTDLMKNSTEEKELVEIAEHITHSTKKADDMICGLTQLSSLIDGDVENSPINFHAIINRNLQQQKSKFAASTENIQFTTNIKISEYQYHSHPYLVDLILEKVVENAINFSAPARIDPKIHIDIENTGKGILIKVTDNGIGIESHQLKSIFEIFYRGTTLSKGSGLGLYIARMAVNRLGGKIWAQSTFGMETTINILLP